MSTHHEIRSTDPKKTAEFLTSFFGWIIQTWKSVDGEFLVFSDKVENAEILAI